MSMRLLFAVLALLCSGLAQALSDTLEWNWRAVHDVPLHWDNIEGGSAQWIDGVRPAYDRASGLHLVRLEGGEYSLVEVPAGQWLYVVSQDGVLQTGDLVLTRSVDGRLFVPEAVRSGADGRTVLTGELHVDGGRVRIAHGTNDGTPLRLALFVSRTPQTGEILDYPYALAIGTGATAVRLAERPGSRTWWQLEAQQDAQLVLQGPQRIRLGTRLVLAPHTRSADETYRIEARLDGEPYQVLELETGDERRTVIAADACTVAAGQLRHAYVDIPAGTHQLVLRSSRALYLQLAGSRGQADYLFRRNVPGVALKDYPGRPGASVWSEPDAGLQTLFSPATAVSDAERIAQRLARDNHWQAANLLAAHGLAGAGDYSFETLSRAALARQRAATLQQYDDLLPDAAGAFIRQRSIGFGRLTLADDDDPALLWQQQLATLAAGGDRGVFVKTPGTAGEALRYRVPARDHTGLLRVIVASTSPRETGRLHIRFDDGPVQTVSLDRHPEARRSVLLRPDRDTLAAALLAEDQGVPLRHRPVLPWGELPVPAGTRSLMLWSEEENVWTALQLQASASALAREGAYLAELDSLGREQAARRFVDRLRETGRGQLDHAVDPPAGAELLNHWLPLLRHLLVQARYFTLDTADAVVDARRTGVDSAAVRRHSARAERAEQDADWILAVESWSRALKSAPAAGVRALRWRRALALRAAGEAVLADRELWQLYMQGSSPSERDAALRELLRTADEQADAERGVRILSAAVLVHPDTALLERLVPVLVAAGRFREALQVGLLLPGSPSLNEALLDAARAEGWWSAFARVLARLPDGDARRAWAGWPAVGAGDYQRADAIWLEAGAAGAVPRARLQRALAIRAAFNHPDPAHRRQALLDWEAWQRASLESSVWRAAPHTVSAFAGSATVVVPQLGVELPHYRATPSRPAELAVYGPARLRINARPLYPADQLLPADDWLMVSRSGQQQRFALNSNAPDPERYLAGDASLQVGQREQFVVEVPPGYHRLHLALRDHAVLFTVDTAQGKQFAEVLPALTPAHAAAMLNGQGAPASAAVRVADWPVQLAETCTIRSVKVSVPVRAVEAEPDATVFAELEALRAPSSQLGEQDLFAQLTAMVWQAEREPARVADIAARAHTLYAQQPADRNVQALMRRLARSMSWAPVTNLWQRAGVRAVDTSVDAPEHPAARIRYALLPELDMQEERISGWSVLVFSVEQPGAVDFAFDFTLEGLLAKPAHDMRVAVRIDEQEERFLTLGPARLSNTYRRTIGAGAHSVRIRLPDPVAQQSVRVRVRERHADNSWTLHALRPDVRSYDIATAGEPVVMYAEGPGLIRVDEWRDDHVVYRYQHIGEGWQKLAFTVQPGQDEALYRVFQWVADRPRPGVPVRLPESRLPALAQAPVVVAAAAEPAPPRHERLSLGRQEDGTLAGTLELASRRNLDEDRNAGTDAERFVELRATHRRYLSDWQAYHRFDALTRVREDGGPTLGLNERIDLPTGWHDLDLDLAGALYVQQPGGAADTEWLADLRGSLSQRRDLTARSYHRPALNLFRRWMSLDNPLANDPERVDQDVFTTYKRQHRQGLGLGDELFYAPRTDVVTWLGISATSNDDFNLFDPDHLRGKVGARALWGDWDVGAEYVVTQYFEDDDRNSDRSRERLRLETNLWRWGTPRNGLQARLRFDHDRSSADNSLWLSFSWQRANGRLARDFRAGDLHFRDLRQRLNNERLYGDGAEVRQ